MLRYLVRGQRGESGLEVATLLAVKLMTWTRPSPRRRPPLSLFAPLTAKKKLLLAIEEA